MKTLFKNILVLAVMLGTYTSYANASLGISPRASKVNKGDYITVADASGEIIYSGRVNYTGSLNKLYDFSYLNDGVYTVEIDKDYEIAINYVEVKDKVATVSENTGKIIFKPVFRSKASQVIISKIAIDSKEMKIELYYENDLIHSETVEGNDVLNRVYKLDNTLKGNYTAVVRANGRVFTENFKL